LTPTRTRTITPTPSPTSAVPIGPIVSYFGLAGANDVAMMPTGSAGGIPIFEPAFGSGFSIVVEAARGVSNRTAGVSTYSPGDVPDLQIQVTRQIGDGSPDVCDDIPGMLGGVPAISPPSFDRTMQNDDAINDLACRFLDGAGAKRSRQCGSATACLLMPNGDFGCADSRSSSQYCAQISQNLEFPPGDTLVTVRVLDTSRNPGVPRQIIIRIP